MVQQQHAFAIYVLQFDYSSDNLVGQLFAVALLESAKQYSDTINHYPLGQSTALC